MSSPALCNVEPVEWLTPLKTRSFLDFQMDHKIAARTNRQVSRGVEAGVARSQRVKLPAGIGTSSRFHTSAARGQSKKRCLPVSGREQAAQPLEGTQCL
jgi:hypothetical protein